MTGFNLPPGCNVRDIPGCGDDPPCAVCAKPADACICPECPICHDNGNPACYGPNSAAILRGRTKRKRSAHRVGRGHGLKLSKQQAISRQEAVVFVRKERLQEDEQYLEQIKSGDFSTDLSDAPDPWA